MTKITLERDALLKLLQKVMGVVERKQTMPILAHVLLELTDKQLSIVGTDLEVELIGYSELPQPVAAPIRLTVPGRKLLDICRALPDGASVTLSYDASEAKILLSSGRSRFTLSTLPADDFPSSRKQQANLSLMLLEKDLLRLLQRTQFAMAQQDVRYYLNGMLLEVGGGALKAVATDGHRLASNVLSASVEQQPNLQVIVPRKAVLELQRLLSDNDRQVEVVVGTTFIRVVGDNFSFTSQLIEGRFPDYKQVIPKGGDKTITLNRDQLKQALLRSAILCDEKFRAVSFQLSSNQLKILSNNPQQEVAEEEIVVDYNQEPFGMGFNVTYLLDVLNTLETPEVNMTFSGPGNSVLVGEVTATQDGVFVVMPLRM